MTSPEVIHLYSTLVRAGVEIWIDGGWGVDALLGENTRPHADLDIAVEWKYVPRLRELLGALGYREARRENQWNFVLAHGNGHELDVHAFVRDQDGHIVDGIMYPADALTGHGTVAGIPVQCISPEYMVKFHTGYPLRDKDIKDVSALCERFGIEFPEEYSRFKTSS